MKRSTPDEQFANCRSLNDLTHLLGKADVLGILRLLADGPLTCGELSGRLEIENSALSAKLRPLRELNVVKSTQRKKFRIYSLRSSVRVTRHGDRVELRVRIPNGDSVSFDCGPDRIA